MNEWDKVQSSILWEWAKREFSDACLPEKIYYYGKALFPKNRSQTEEAFINASAESKLEVLMRLPKSSKLIASFLTKKQVKVVKLLEKGYSYKEIAQQVGYAHRGNVKLSLDETKKRIIKAIGG